MAKSKTSAVLSAFIPLLLCGSFSLASDKNTDPNAALRRNLNPPGSSVLAELERVQKTNNQLAVDHFTKLIQKDPKDAPSYASRGKAYSGLKKYDLALVDYNTAIRLDGKLADAYVGRAVIHYLDEDYDASWKDVHQAQALGGEFWPSFMEALKESSGTAEQVNQGFDKHTP